MNLKRTPPPTFIVPLPPDSNEITGGKLAFHHYLIKKNKKQVAQLLIVVYGKTNMFSCFMMVIGPIIYMLIEMQNICNLSDCCFDCWHNPLQSVVNRDMPW